MTYNLNESEDLSIIYQFVNEFRNVEDLGEDSESFLLEVYEHIENFLTNTPNLKFLLPELERYNEFANLYTFACKIVLLTSQNE